MIDSLLEELPQPGVPEDEQIRSAADDRGTPPRKHAFLAALPVVQRIVGRRRSSLDSTNVSDLVQEVALRLWRWSTNHQEKSEKMSSEEWSAFAARTAYNEVKRYFSGRNLGPNVDPDMVSEIEGSSLEGQTEIEVFSLIHQVWQGICEMSGRQRRALLLHSQELIIYFLQSGITEKELAAALEFSEEHWCTIRDQLPMTDAQIAREAEGGSPLIRPSTVGSVKKARYEARVKLEGLIRK
jgi:DNA-directed RNA polymerase specialized sigma24 family protein